VDIVTLLDSPAKAQMIRKVARQHGLRTLVETGTACGDIAWEIGRRFDRIVTIEQDRDMFLSAQRRLQRWPHVQVIHGDSGLLLGDVLAGLPASLVFCDAHEVADAGDSALRQEMDHIARAEHRPVVLIDDARLCSDARGWMSEASIAEWCVVNRYESPMLTDDVLILIPEEN
jgi:predicted O-methyltransferase YrrM